MLNYGFSICLYRGNVNLLTKNCIIIYIISENTILICGTSVSISMILQKFGMNYQGSNFNKKQRVMQDDR